MYNSEYTATAVLPDKYNCESPPPISDNCGYQSATFSGAECLRSTYTSNHLPNEYLRCNDNSKPEDDLTISTQLFYGGESNNVPINLQRFLNSGSTVNGELDSQPIAIDHRPSLADYKKLNISLEMDQISNSSEPSDFASNDSGPLNGELNTIREVESPAEETSRFILETSSSGDSGYVGRNRLSV